MIDCSDILKQHAERYRLMQPQDAVKLLYQNEFGGGHLISDVSSCRARLAWEYAQTPHDPSAVPFEEIGNGVLRVHLAAVLPTQLDALGDAFIASATEHVGSFSSFLEKLELLRFMTSRGIFSFDSHALSEYLAVYADHAYPCVSHSEIYRRAYHPAYRIILQRHRDLS